MGRNVRKHSAAQLGFDLREIKELGGASVEAEGFAVSWYKHEATIYRAEGTGFRVIGRGSLTFIGEGPSECVTLAGGLGPIPMRAVEALEAKLTQRLCRGGEGAS